MANRKHGTESLNSPKDLDDRPGVVNLDAAGTHGQGIDNNEPDVIFGNYRQEILLRPLVGPGEGRASATRSMAAASKPSVRSLGSTGSCSFERQVEEPVRWTSQA
jgi:hypothetical protein